MELTNWARRNPAKDIFSKIIETSPEAYLTQISSVKAARNLRNDQPEKLENIAMNFIVGNRRLFKVVEPDSFKTFLADNPFSSLPSPLVQSLLKLAEESINSNKKTSDDNLHFLLQLLNSEITEFDFETIPWAKSLSDSKKALVFKHLMHSCPKIETVKVFSGVWEDKKAFLPKEHRKDPFRLMASCWPNLTYLTFYFKVDRSCFSPGSKSLIHTICTNLPNLRGLKTALLYEDYSQDDLELLAKMEHLEELSIAFCGLKISARKHLNIVIQTAGRLPHLKKFGFKFQSGNRYQYQAYEDFVEAYGREYPKKKITMEEVIIMIDNMRCPWPSCVAADELKIAEVDTFSLANILAIESPVQKLSFFDVDPDLIYDVVEKLGAGITHFKTMNTKKEKFHEDLRLDVGRILFSCPNLQSFILTVREDVRYGTLIDELTPATFSNCKFFEVTVERHVEDYIEALVELSKLYLLGSAKFEQKKLQIRSLNVLMGLRLALLETDKDGAPCKTCVDQVEEIHIIFDEFGLEFPHEELVQTIFLLFERSPYFKKLLVSEGNLCIKTPEWFPLFVKDLGISYKLVK